MYSYEDRIRAVKLFIKLGMRPKATIRQLGYPTKNALIGWYRAFIKESDLQAGYIRSIQKYSTDQKQAAVRHYLDHDSCIAGTLRALGYPCRATLVGWIEELQPGIRQRIVGRAPNIQHPQEIKNAAVIKLCTRKTSAEATADTQSREKTNPNVIVFIRLTLVVSFCNFSKINDRRSVLILSLARRYGPLFAISLKGPGVFPSGIRCQTDKSFLRKHSSPMHP